MRTRHDSTGIMAAIYASAACLLLLVSQAAHAATPAWIQQAGWAVPDIGTFAKPAMADLDGDGLPDLMVGAANGQIYAFKNTGTVSAPVWTAQASWNMTSPCSVSTPGATVPQTYASPALGDMNGDGKIDMIVGTKDGVCAYQNTGTASAPVWTRNTAWDISSITRASNYYSPALGDLNGDGKLDVMLGNRFVGNVDAYENTATTTTSDPVWTANTAWNLYYLGGSTSPTLGDIDGDTKIDMLVGDVYGTVYAYKNVGTNASPSWESAGAWFIPDPNNTTSNYAGPVLGDMNNDGVSDTVMVGDASGVSFGYQKNPAGLPDPGFPSSPPPSTGSTVTETFESFGCTGSWKPAAGGPNTSYTRDCGNGWTAFAEDTNNPALGAIFPGPIGDQNVVTLDSTANGPSISSTTPGAAEMYTNPGPAPRGVLWMLKTIPVTPRVQIQNITADFRIKVASTSPASQYYGMVVFDGVVSNPSGTTLSGVPQRPDVLARDIQFTQCGNNIWCPWHVATMNTAVTPSSGEITVAFMIQDTLTSQVSYMEADNLKVTNVANVTPSSVATNDIAQLWKQDYSDPNNNPDIGIDNWSESKAIKLDSAGNVYVAADVYASASDHTNGLSNSDIAVFKYDSAGNLLWKQTYDGGDSDQAVALGVDGSDNVYVTGRSFGAGTNAGTNDNFVIIKYNSSGVQQWAQVYDNTSRIDDPTGLVVDSSGNSYITGNSCADAVTCEFLTVKYDTSGTEQWHAVFNNTGSILNKAVGIGTDGSGNVYVSGTVSGGSDNIATVMYSSAGAQVGVSIYDGGTNDRAIKMKTDSAGNVYIAGLTYSAGSPGILVLKYSSAVISASGNTPEWTQVYNSIPEALPTAMTIDSSSVYITGVVGAAGDHDFVTIRLMNNTGAVAWAQVFGNAGVNDSPNAVAVDGGGNVYVAGSMTQSSGNTNFVLLRYDASGIARNAITFDGYTLADAPAALTLGVDSQGDTAPYVTGVSADPLGINHISTLRYTKAQPDLIMSAVGGPTSAVVGSTISISNTVLNISDLANKIYANSGEFDIGLYIAPSIGGLPDMAHVTQLATRHVTNLAPGDQSSASTSATIPSTLAEGTYVLFAKADIGDTVVEANETNNTTSATGTIDIQGILPDLVVSSVTGPSTATHGTPFDVSTTIANIVSTAASSSFRVGIYASTDSTVTTADTLIGSYTVASLAGFASASATTSVTIPSAGTYYIGAIVDDQGAITEQNENNNTTLMVSGTSSSTLLSTKSDFVAGLPGTNVAVVKTLGSANVRLSQAAAWSTNSAWNSADVGSNGKPALGDLNGDGLQDLIMGDSTGKITGYVNTGSATAPVWTAAPSAWNISTPCTISGGNNPQTYTVPVLADLNGDGLLDLVVGLHDGVCIYQNVGSVNAPAWALNSTWTSSFTGLPLSRFYGAAVADLNNDGKPDILLGDSTTTIKGYINDGASVSSPHWSANTAWDVTGLPTVSRNMPALADIDGDGDYDLMVGTSAGDVLGYRNDGTLSAPVWVANSAWNIADPNTSLPDYPRLAIADLNGDGSLDFMYGDRDGVAYGYQNVGLFSTSGTYTSKVIDTVSNTGYTTLAYTAVVPTGTTLAVDVRAGDTSSFDGTWTTITSVPNGGNISGLGTSRYVQYVFHYTTTNTAVSPAVYNIQANTAPPAPAPITVGLVVGEGSGGGELSLMELVLLNLLVLAGMGRRRKKIMPL